MNNSEFDLVGAVMLTMNGQKFTAAKVLVVTNELFHAGIWQEAINVVAVAKECIKRLKA